MRRDILITLGAAKLEQNGLVQGMFVTEFEPQFAPAFIWLDGICTRVCSLISWLLEEKLYHLVEISNGCQILIEYGNLYDKEPSNYKSTYNAKIIIPEKTSERHNNYELWENFKKFSLNVEYPYIYLYHHTEEDKYPLIINDNMLKSSTWNLAGTNELKITFSNLTDIKEVKHTFELWPLAMKQQNGLSVMIRDDYGAIINADIYVTDRNLNKSLKLKVDTGLIIPCHIIQHFQSGEWWEYFYPNIFRIYSSFVSLKVIDDYFLVDKNQVEGYKPSKGFIMASGEDASSIQNLLYESNIYDFF